MHGPRRLGEWCPECGDASACLKLRTPVTRRGPASGSIKRHARPFAPKCPEILRNYGARRRRTSCAGDAPDLATERFRVGPFRPERIFEKLRRSSGLRLVL